MQDLSMHGQCATLGLTPLSTAASATYVSRRFGSTPPSDPIVQVLQQRTNGHPLFLVTLVETLVQQGALHPGPSGPVANLATMTASIPETLRQLLERQLAQLTAVEQAVLEAASVAGTAFAVAAVAAAVERSSEDVEECCAAFARRGQFLHICGSDIWADGTSATRYGFVHAL